MGGRKKRRKARPGRQRPDSPEGMRLCRESYPQVRSWFLARVANKQDADDLTAEIFARLVRGATPRDLNAYLTTATANALARYQRRRASERDFLRRLLEEATKTDEMRIREQRDLSEEEESGEQCAAVEKLLGTLPHAQAQLLRLRFLDGLRMAQVARRLGCSRNAAYKRLRQIIRRLRERYAVAPPDPAPQENPQKS